MFKVNPDRIVIGKRAVTELLINVPERAENFLYAGKGELPEGQIKSLVHKYNLKVKSVRSDELRELTQSDSHQGMAVILKERYYSSITEVVKQAEFATSSLLVMLDGVTDPHNLGAVMRAAECFGADGVIWSKNRAAGITPVVTKSAAGASELLKLVPVGNLADAVRKLKAENFWILAAALTDKAISLAEFDVPKKSVLVLGAEGDGISPLVLKLADFILQVPMVGAISSLNVSQASSVFLYELRKKLDAK